MRVSGSGKAGRDAPAFWRTDVRAFETFLTGGCMGTYNNGICQRKNEEMLHKETYEGI